MITQYIYNNNDNAIFEVTNKKKITNKQLVTMAIKIDIDNNLLINANLQNSNFQDFDFSGKNLTGVDFTDCNLTDCNFTDCNLTGAKIDNCNIVCATFINCIIDNTTSFKSTFDSVYTTLKDFKKMNIKPEFIRVVHTENDCYYENDYRKMINNDTFTMMINGQKTYVYKDKNIDIDIIKEHRDMIIDNLEFQYSDDSIITRCIVNIGLSNVSAGKFYRFVLINDHLNSHELVVYKKE